jgi:hypothetical protein
MQLKRNVLNKLLHHKKHIYERLQTLVQSYFFKVPEIP